MPDRASANTEESIESSLKDYFKLSSYEARAYLALLKLGKQNPKQLSSTSTVPLPRIYDTLESLMAKGFALKNEDNAYSAIFPRHALRGRSSQFEVQFAQEQKQRKVIEDELVNSLESLTKADSPSGPVSGEISILKGFNSIAIKFEELLSKSSEIILIAKRAMEARQVFIPILLELKNDGSSKKKKRNIRIIVPEEADITKEEIEAAQVANAEIRKSAHILFDMMIADSSDVIIGVPDPLSEEINHAVAIWVWNTSFASSTRKSVEEIWKSARKI
jgi:sugar-specific transcriptional regulator TrmB